MALIVNPSLLRSRTRLFSCFWRLGTVSVVVLAVNVYATMIVAGDYSIKRHAVSGGGGSSAGGNYSLSGTIGQPVAGTSTADNFSVASGIWAMLTTVQDPETPRLSLTLTATNTVLLSWPSPSSGFVLQQTADGSGTNWVGVAQAPVDDGATRSVVSPPQAGHVLFRLKKTVGGVVNAK